MLSGKQKRYLRAIAAKERSIYQIGKEGLSFNLFNGISNALKANELVKVNILKTSSIDVREAAIEISANTSSEIVQIIGKTIVFYKASKDKKIILP